MQHQHLLFLLFTPFVTSSLSIDLATCPEHRHISTCTIAICIAVRALQPRRAMASRLPPSLSPLARAFSSTAASARTRAAVAGSRIDTTTYTDTGGSGADSTALSSDLAEASAKAVAAYRTALRAVPAMRKNFTIIEDKMFVNRCIRDLFERHADVSDPKIVDMLVFKALQELREIREQWKSRHHVYGYIHAYMEKVLKEEAARKVTEQTDVDRLGMDEKRNDILRAWKSRQLIPPEIQTWAQYIMWKEEEDAKFNAFAVDNKLFTQQQLERNAAAQSSCTIM